MKKYYKVILANSEVLTVYPYISFSYLELLLEGTNAKTEEYKPEETLSKEAYDLNQDFEGDLRKDLRIKALEAYVEFLTDKRFDNKL